MLAPDVVGPLRERDPTAGERSSSGRRGFESGPDEAVALLAELGTQSVERRVGVGSPGRGRSLRRRRAVALARACGVVRGEGGVDCARACRRSRRRRGTPRRAPGRIASCSSSSLASGGRLGVRPECAWSTATRAAGRDAARFLTSPSTFVSAAGRFRFGTSVTVCSHTGHGSPATRCAASVWAACASRTSASRSWRSATIALPRASRGRRRARRRSRLHVRRVARVFERGTDAQSPPRVRHERVRARRDRGATRPRCRVRRAHVVPSPRLRSRRGPRPAPRRASR